jgi:CubicO group peptidase (beta-lactamase class C family)
MREMNSISNVHRSMVMFLLLLSAAGGAAAPDPATAAPAGAVEGGLLPQGAFPPWIRESIPSRLAHYGIPGLSIAVLDEYRVVWAKGYGVAEIGTNRPVTADTLFPAVGNSSFISGYLAMVLVERGVLAPEEDIAPRLRSWQLPPNRFTAAGKPVTLKSLVYYEAAGLNQFLTKGYRRDEPCPTLRQMLDGVHPAANPPVRVISEPGIYATKIKVDLVSYLVLQQLLEEVTGRPFPDIAAECLLRPLGLTASTFAQPLPADRWDRATSCHEGDTPIPGGWRVYPDAAAMGFWTTPSEFARLIAEAGKSYRGLSTQFVSRATAEKIRLVGRPSHRLFSDAAGCESDILFNPDTGQGVVLMMNGNRGSHLLRDEILHSVFKQYRWTWGSDLIWNDTFKQGWMLTAALALAGLIAALAAGQYFLSRNR